MKVLVKTEYSSNKCTTLIALYTYWIAVILVSRQHHAKPFRKYKKNMYKSK